MASVFVSSGTVQSEDWDIYTYACEQVLANATHLVLSAIISSLFDLFAEGMAFVFCFVLLRHFTGGHHAKHHWGCILTFACILTAALSVLTFLPMEAYWFLSLLLIIVTIGSVFILAPIKHENKPMSARDCYSLKKRSRVVVTATSGIVIMGLVFTQSKVIVALALSMGSVSGSMAFATLIKRMKGCPQ